MYMYMRTPQQDYDPNDVTLIMWQGKLCEPRGGRSSGSCPSLHSLSHERKLDTPLPVVAVTGAHVRTRSIIDQFEVSENQGSVCCT